ncbi:DHH family phosphoesterase [Patescibacteria group bacterium]|jgi:phosphoesterase RecJ-like protein|nr:DHH family phosphoesterase [Patescibacteria group bacterium]
MMISQTVISYHFNRKIMELSPKQQAVELIRASHRVLIVAHENPDGDALGSSLSLALTLNKLKKDVTTAIAGPMPPIYNFLPNIDMVNSEVSGAKEFTVSVDIENIEVEKLGYKTDDKKKKLSIIISTSSGNIEPKNVTLGASTTPYDLIIVLDSPDLDRLSTIYDSNPDLFYEVPVINIDHHPSNEYFGKVNWIDVTAASTSEILVSLIEALSAPHKGEPAQTLMDPDIATLLLTGLTTDTNSFQNANTTPKSLTVAAQLVASGARQQEIIRNIYKTKPLTTLKLWGRALSNLREVSEARFVFATLTSADFSDLGAEEQEASGVIDELMKSTGGVDFAMLISERNGGVHGSLRSVDKGVDVSTIARIFGGGGHDTAAAFHLDNTTLERELERIISKITSFRQRNIDASERQAAMPELQEEKKTQNGSDKW